MVNTTLAYIFVKNANHPLGLIHFLSTVKMLMFTLTVVYVPRFSDYTIFLFKSTLTDKILK